MDIRYEKTIPGNEDEILSLYKNAGWTVYINNPEKMMNAIRNSSAVYSAYSDNVPVGLARTISDRESITYVQDILVHSDFRKKKIGTTLMKMIFDDNSDVNSIVLLTDIDDVTDAFYRSMGFKEVSELNCRAFINIKGDRICF